MGGWAHGPDAVEEDAGAGGEGVQGRVVPGVRRQDGHPAQVLPCRPPSFSSASLTQWD